MQRKRYAIGDVAAYSFFQLPKFLFDGELKSGLSNNAKVLYSLLRNRHELSLINGWANENGEVYIIFSRDEMCRALGKSAKTVGEVMKELAKCGLVDEERQGLGKPNLIFLSYIESLGKPSQSADTQGIVNSTLQETQDLPNKNGKNSTSRSAETTLQEVQNLRPNKTNNNKTEFINTDFSQSVNRAAEVDEIDRSGKNKVDAIRDVVHKNISFAALYERYPADKNLLTEIAELITETVETTHKTIRIRGEDLPSEVVKSRFLELDDSHVRHVLEEFSKVTHNVRNPRNYLLTALYNAPLSTEARLANSFAIGENKRQKPVVRPTKFNNFSAQNDVDYNAIAIQKANKMLAEVGGASQ